VLLVGAYRTTKSVLPTHFCDAGSNPQSRSAGPGNCADPLGLDDVGALVSDALRCRPTRCRPWRTGARKDRRKSVFAIQFFTRWPKRAARVRPSHAAWQWDINRIRAKSYTDNVVDLMSESEAVANAHPGSFETPRLSGQYREVATLALVRANGGGDVRGALGSRPCRAGLSPREHCKFLHDRIQQAPIH